MRIALSCVLLGRGEFLAAQVGSLGSRLTWAAAFLHGL